MATIRENMATMLDVDVGAIVDDTEGLVAYLAKPVDMKDETLVRAAQALNQLRVARAAIVKVTGYVPTGQGAPCSEFRGPYVPLDGIADCDMATILDNIVVDAAIFGATPQRRLDDDAKDRIMQAYWHKLDQAMATYEEELGTAIDQLAVSADSRSLADIPELAPDLGKMTLAVMSAGFGTAPKGTKIAEVLKDAALAGLVPHLEKAGYNTEAYTGD